MTDRCPYRDADGRRCRLHEMHVDGHLFEAREGIVVEQTENHRCSGCGHRWEGPLKGVELCGDCWRRGQSAILSAASASDLSALRRELWRLVDVWNRFADGLEKYNQNPQDYRSCATAVTQVLSRLGLARATEGE